MAQIVIKEYGTYREGEVLALYKSVGWSAYYTQPALLKQAFSNSLCILGAYDGERLVALIRAVGDGASVVFIQDILVHPVYQRRGIGTNLVRRIQARYSHVRQMHLLTDDLPKNNGFYSATGFTPVEQIRCRAFTRLR